LILDLINADLLKIKSLHYYLFKFENYYFFFVYFKIILNGVTYPDLSNHFLFFVASKQHKYSLLIYLQAI